jgi:hypothetical protein
MISAAYIAIRIIPPGIMEMSVIPRFTRTFNTEGTIITGSKRTFKKA